MGAFLVVPGLLAALAAVPKAANAGWFDPAWGYRRAVTVSNPGQALSGYQVRISLDASFDFSRAQSDGADLRATATDGMTALPFWVEEWNPAAQKATLWVKVATVPAGSATIYLYYGNPAAPSANSGDATFNLFDDSSGSAAPSDVYGNWPRMLVDPYLDGAHNVGIEQIDGDGKPDIVADGYQAGLLKKREVHVDTTAGGLTPAVRPLPDRL